MLQVLYDYFLGLLNFETYIGFDMSEYEFTLFSQNDTLLNYLCVLCTYVSFFFIFVLCCLFVYKIIKLIGGLIR